MRVKLIKGDITALEVDAIVNPANVTLFGGDGINETIHKKAGFQLLDECIRIRKEQFIDGLMPGEAVITPGFDLPAKFIIHTVGPIYDNLKDQSEILTSCFVRCLDVAEVNEVYTIAFPAFPYNLDELASTAKKVFDHYEYHNVKEIIVCLENDDEMKAFREVFDKI